jgi:hypothetical protein
MALEKHPKFSLWGYGAQHSFFRKGKEPDGRVVMCGDGEIAAAQRGC